MKYFLPIFAIFLFLGFTTPTYAVVNPLDSPNNKYGIHIVDENDLPAAASLVNSTGGNWGYVTIVIRDDDRRVEKWQKIFDTMRNLHLIPIIRLATHPVGKYWTKPKNDDAKVWAQFLNNLYWVTKNRYVVIFNEPNHAKEFGGDINAAEYAQILKNFALSLKQASKDFFILPAGLDASAPASTDTMDEITFLRGMISSVPEVFSYIDGWTSHSYPNPGFVGKISDTGRGTLRTFHWEMGILRSLGQRADFPVFITETGWPHQEGLTVNKTYYPAAAVSDLLQKAAEDIWADPSIVAVTPFILNYQSYPFANFSWQRPNENTFYSFYDTYKSQSKIAGSPKLYTIFEDIDHLALLKLRENDNSKILFLQPQAGKNFLAGFFYRLFKL